ncbi:MAG: ferritin-like protein [Chloroflexi bacterium]|nr:ferritin-like protein [Chloroflexota bacterium]
MTTESSRVPPGRGKLAGVVALRRTHATPERPFLIEHREALIYVLCLAAELEHSIMSQYLYAAFSLKQGADENVTSEQLEAIERWRKAVTHVATQEMLHLALVQNLLTSIGAAPHLGRPNLPPPPGHFPASVSLALLPFGEAALRHFMYLERPEGMRLDDAEGLRMLEQATPAVRHGDIVPQLQDFETVGHLYRSIEEGIRSLADKYGEARLFCGPREAQAVSASFGWNELVAVGDVDSALVAVNTIIEQGEGARGDWRTAHFGKFVQILEEYLAMRERAPDFQAARPVLPANVRAHERDSSIPLITDPLTARCTDLFNVSYEVLLLVLQRYFGHLEETDAQFGVLVDVALNLMFEIIEPLAQLVTRLPVGADYPGRTAGPSFELFYESDYVLPHRRAAWLLLEERLRDAHAFCRRIQAEAPDLSVALQPIATSLDKQASALASS